MEEQLKAAEGWSSTEEECNQSLHTEGGNKEEITAPIDVSGQHRRWPILTNLFQGVNCFLNVKILSLETELNVHKTKMFSSFPAFIVCHVSLVLWWKTFSSNCVNKSSRKSHTGT